VTEVKGFERIRLQNSFANYFELEGRVMNAGFGILLISLSCLIAGSAGICAVISGPWSIVAAPLFAIFGWFYFFPICLLVSAMWWLYRGRFTMMPWRLAFFFLGPALGGGLMILQGALSGTKDVILRDGMTLGGILAGAVSNLMVASFKRQVCPLPNLSSG
jgi:hypothetical protein